MRALLAVAAIVLSVSCAHADVNNKPTGIPVIQEARVVSETKLEDLTRTCHFEKGDGYVEVCVNK